MAATALNTTPTSNQPNTYTNENGHFVAAVDAEHAGIRVVGCFSFIIVAVASFVILSLLMPEAVFLTFIGSGILAALVTQGVDMILRRNWPSGRMVVATDEALQIKRRETVERSIDPQKMVNLLAWRFEIPRNTRAKKGWYVVALSLEQDGGLLPVYTFMSPETFDNLDMKHHFEKLTKDLKKKSAEPEMRIAGRQRRLLDAEHDRGDWGAEMSVEQFKAYLAYLKRQYPNWMLQD